MMMDKFKNAINQKFPFHVSMMCYIFKNSQSNTPQLNYKLLFTSKYFYTKYKTIPCFGINIENRDMCIAVNEQKWIKVPIKFIDTSNCKFYVYSQFVVYEDSPPSATSQFFKHLLKLNLRICRLRSQTLTFKEFNMLNPKIIKDLTMWEVLVTHSDGIILPFDELLSYAPNATSIDWANEFNHFDAVFTTKTAQKIADLDHIGKFSSFSLHVIPRSFDRAAFATFIKKNSRPKSYYSLTFRDFDNKFGQKFTTIIKQTLDAWVRKEDAPTFKIWNVVENQ